MGSINSLLFDESGQSLVEYGLIISLVAVVAAAALIIFGEHLRDYFKFDMPTTTVSN